MKSRFFFLFLTASFVFAAHGGQTAPPGSSRPIVQENFRQLLATNACPSCDLAGADLTRLKLAGANLEGANLAGTKFSLADLSGANLRNANLQGANLGGADLANADLEGANLTGALLEGAFLATAKMTGSIQTRPGRAAEVMEGVGEKVFVPDDAQPKSKPYTQEVIVEQPAVPTVADAPGSSAVMPPQPSPRPPVSVPKPPPATPETASVPESPPATLETASAPEPSVSHEPVPPPAYSADDSGEAKKIAVMADAVVPAEVLVASLAPGDDRGQVQGSESVDAERPAILADTAPSGPTVADQFVAQNEETVVTVAVKAEENSQVLGIGADSPRPETAQATPRSGLDSEKEYGPQPVQASVSRSPPVIQEAIVPPPAFSPATLAGDVAPVANVDFDTGKQDTLDQLFSDKRCIGCDLSRMDLAGKNLSGFDLERADLSGSDLRGARLGRANLKGTNFRNAYLQDADLRRADLYRADFTGADLTGARLENALIDGADFTGALGLELEGALVEE